MLKCAYVTVSLKTQTAAETSQVGTFFQDIRKGLVANAS